MTKNLSVACPGCTCLCDDVVVTPSKSAPAVLKACDLGKQWFREGFEHAKQPPTHSIDGKPCSLEQGIAAAADVLNNAQAPLISSLEQLSVAAQQVAWKLADATRATIDPSLSHDGHAGGLTLPKHGKVTATLGEIASRSDLIVFWFCDPVKTHPRFLERVARERSAKKIVVVDETETVTARQADRFVSLSTDNAASMLQTCRALLKESDIEPEQTQNATGLDSKELSEFVSELQAAQYGTFVYGHTTHDSQFDVANDQLALLTRELNHHTRFVSVALRGDANGQSAENVITWSSGYPFAVNYGQGMPRYNGNEYSAQSVLARAECDAVLVGPTDGSQLQKLPQAALEVLKELPTIELTTSSRSATDAQIVIQVAQPGIDDAGDFCRLDDVALPLTKLVQTDRPTAEQVLTGIVDATTS